MTPAQRQQHEEDEAARRAAEHSAEEGRMMDPTVQLQCIRDAVILFRRISGIRDWAREKIGEVLAATSALEDIIEERRGEDDALRHRLAAYQAIVRRRDAECTAYRDENERMMRRIVALVKGRREHRDKDRAKITELRGMNASLKRERQLVLECSERLESILE
jgi:hypothetical protein